MKDLKSGYLISLKQKAWLSLKGSHALGNETRTFFNKIDFSEKGPCFIPKGVAAF